MEANISDNIGTNGRIERFKAEAADLNLKTSNQSRDSLLQGLGLALMVAAVVVGFVAYQASLGSDDPRDIQSYIVLAISLLALAVLGGALFLRYSMAKFLRFWLLRQLYEGQAHVDQVVAAMGQEARPEAPLDRTPS
jgi:hypothetical protein